MAVRALSLALAVFLAASGSVLAQEPAGETQAEFSFVVIGHVRGERDNEPYFLRDELIAEVAALEPDAVIFVGDMIFGDWLEPGADPARITAHWDRFDTAWSQVGAPVLRAPGNHDINDPVTRDIYFERYGTPPHVVTIGNNRLLLLSSAHIPEGDAPAPLPRPFPRGKDITPKQLAFLKQQIEDAGDDTNIFLFMHHLLWWSQDRAWWTDVHPVLAGSNVRAVFGGDFGPTKFSYNEKDGIDYYHTTLAKYLPPERLRSDNLRVLFMQFDNFLHVKVNGDDVDVDVRVLGAESSGKHTPEYWDTAFTAPAAELTLQDRVRRFLGGPQRQVLLAALLAGSFVMGAALTWLLLRRRSNS